MNTNNKKHPVWAYIQNAICPDYYSEATGKVFEKATNTEKWQFVADEFKSWLNPYELKRAGSYQNAFAYWLQCSPGAVNIAEYYHDILALAKIWGSLPENATEKQEDKIIANYYNFMAAKMMQAMRKVGVSVY